MLCICCLKQDCPLIKLTKYCHGDFLNEFFKNDLLPLEQVVCWECHMTLKKINKFKKQVVESFKQLMKQSQNKELSDFKEEDIIEEPCSIPDEVNVEKENYNRLKNINTALNIINSNTASLSSITLLETVLAATKESLNLQSTVLPEAIEINENSIKQSEDEVTNIYQSAVLSAKNRKLNLGRNVLPVANNIQQKSDNEVEITDVYGSVVLSDVKNKPDIEMLQDHNNCDRHINENIQELCSDVCNQSMLLLPDIHQYITQAGISSDKNEVTITDSCTTKADLKSETDIEIMLPADNIKLPEENDNNKKIVSDCDMTVLPHLKNNTDAVFEINSSSCIEVVTDKNIDNSNDKDETTKPLKPLNEIKLKRKQLLAERKKKLLSMEFRKSKYKCDNCIIGFEFKINLKDHIQRRHTEKPNSVTCKICKQVILRSDTQQHKFRHYNRFECNICKQRFILYDDGYSHYMEVHFKNNNIGI